MSGGPAGCTLTIRLDFPPGRMDDVGAFLADLERLGVSWTGTLRVAEHGPRRRLEGVPLGLWSRLVRPSSGEILRRKLARRAAPRRRRGPGR